MLVYGGYDKWILNVYTQYFFDRVYSYQRLNGRSGFTNEPHSGVNVPTLDIPLLDPEIMQLQENIDPLQESACFGVDIYLNTVRYVENLLEAR